MKLLGMVELFISPVVLYFFKGLSCGFRNDFPHDQHVWKTHYSKNEERASLAPFKEDRRELTDEVGPDPEHESGN